MGWSGPATWRQYAAWLLWTSPPKPKRMDPRTETAIEKQRWRARLGNPISSTGPTDGGGNGN